MVGPQDHDQGEPRGSVAVVLVNRVKPLHMTLLELGMVSFRMVLLLRPAEIQPSFRRFVLNTTVVCYNVASIRL